MTLYRKAYDIVGTSEEITAIDAVFARINQLCTQGSSRKITIEIDGDGSASLCIRDLSLINKEDGSLDVELSRKLHEILDKAKGDPIAFDDEIKAIQKKNEAIGKKSTISHNHEEIYEINEKGDMEVWIGE